jgi:hypothetical protein
VIVLHFFDAVAKATSGGLNIAQEILDGQLRTFTRHKAMVIPLSAFWKNIKPGTGNYYSIQSKPNVGAAAADLTHSIIHPVPVQHMQRT